MFSWWKKFFETDGEPNSKNLTVLLSMVVGSVVILYTAYHDRLSYEMFGLYLFAGGGIYGMGKIQEEATKRKQISSDAPPQNPTTVIQSPEKVSVNNAT